jgi:class 3 adenylate cyclase
MSVTETLPTPNEGARDTAVRTFLIADVRGYTRFTVEHGDEAAARLAGAFAQLAGEVVSASGGEVIELRGDEALAVFNSSRQALRAAVDLQEAFAAASVADPLLPLRVGIGLDAGEAIPIDGGFRGAALNLSARLCSLAGPGEVLASDGVIHLARKLDGLSYLERGLVQLKGFVDPVRVVQVVRESGAVPKLAAETPETPALPPLPIGGFLGSLPAGTLVGREAELQRVLRAVDAVAGGSGRLGLLAGEPGVGKTRLAQEVTLAVRNRGFLLATGRCYEAEAAVPFYPWLDALATLYAEAPAAVRAEVPRRWPDLARLLPDQLGPRPPGSMNSPEEQQLLFRAVTGLVGSLAEQRPVALLLDDLHWADASSLKLLQHLARQTRGQSVLLFGTYRDVEVGRQHPLEAALRDLDREGLLERVPIRRLDAAGTQELIAATMGETEISEEFTSLVHARTEGNPFFVQQVLRVLVERGDLFRKDGRWDRKNIAEIEVPESVRSVIGQRLARLAEETQEILHEASVLGQTFNFDELLALSKRDERELERALDETSAAGMLREAGRDTFGFDHALTQQALYAELSSRRRRRLHLAAGEVIEALSEHARQTRSAELAWHFLEADVPERALPYALLAGEQAAAAWRKRWKRSAQCSTSPGVTPRRSSFWKGQPTSIRRGVTLKAKLGRSHSWGGRTPWAAPRRAGSLASNRFSSSSRDSRPPTALPRSSWRSPSSTSPVDSTTECTR